MGSEILLRRTDRRHYRGRLARLGGLSQRASAHPALAVRRCGQGQAEGPYRGVEAAPQHRAFGLRDRQEYAAHQEPLLEERLPQLSGRGAHRQRHDIRAVRQRNVHHRQEPEGQDRQDQLLGQRGFRRQASAPHLQEDPPEKSQHLQGAQVLRGGLRNG